MDEKVYVQCQVCGKLHQIEKRCASVSEDELYIYGLYCSRCRDGTKHLLIGENKEDVYVYGNGLLDERYFIY